METITTAHHIGLIIVGEKKCDIVRYEDLNTPFYKLINLAQENNLKIFLDSVCVISK